MSQVKEDLLKAAEILEIEGWGQEGYIISGAPDDSTYCYCAGGAILRAVGIAPENINPDDYKGSPEQEDRFDAAMAVLGTALGLTPHDAWRNWNLLIPEWNDSDGQTADNVIAKIREVAGELK